MITAERLRLVFADCRRNPDAPPATRATAAVAAILRESGSALELLFIERARHPEDPWSGDLAFPGGRLEEADTGPRAAAERETLEEVGLDLSSAECLGRLADLTTSDEQMVVAAFVYCLANAGRPDEASSLRLSSEVADAFWFPVNALLEPNRHSRQPFDNRGTDRIYPAIDLLGPGRPVLWGVTHRLVARLLQCLGSSLPPVS